MMTQNPQPPPNQRKVQLEIPANLNAAYSNMAMVTQMHSEIVMDFIQVLPNDPRARVQSRVVMTPANAKAFLNALKHNLERFEATHGEIVLPPAPPTLADQLFGGIKPDEPKDSPNE